MSVATIPGPPALVTMATRLPWGTFRRQFAQGAFVLIGKGRCKIEQLIDTFHTNDPGLLEDGVINRFGAGQSPGVGCRGFCPGAGSAGFDHQDRLGVVARCDLLDGFDEFGPMPEFFQIDHDDFGFLVGMQISQQVEFIHIGFVADGDKLGEPKVPVGGKIKHRRAQRATLGNK